MSPEPMAHDAWLDGNQLDLMAQVGRLRSLLGAMDSPADADRRPGRDDQPATDAQRLPGDAFALAALVRLFGLSPFERDVLLACAAVELDGSFGGLLAAAHGDTTGRFPTFRLALARLPEAHWSALTPAGPLRRWRLIELAGSGLTSASLHIDERILHFLAGLNEVEERLLGLIERVMPAGAPSPAAYDAGRLLAARLAAADGPTVVQLIGPDEDARADALAVAGDLLGTTVLVIAARNLPSTGPERDEVALLCRRERLLSRSVVAVVASADDDAGSVVGFAEAVSAPLVISAGAPLGTERGSRALVEVPALAPVERLELWRAMLGSSAEHLDGALTRAADLALGRRAIAGVVAEARAVALDPDSVTAEVLLDATRRTARPDVGGLAQPIDPRASWDDLVLPRAQRRLLEVMVAHVRHRHRVHEEWGFAAQSERGLGTAALFAGESGTGKTMAAEIVARELHLDLYRIDLASVVSKYIGETEKNLRRLFDGAEGSGAVLLFDEADALFGKRTEVRDSHDRYANVEVSYLLQRVERYRGLAILTTNLKQALDPAFLRRLRFIVRFPYPDAAQRKAIWERVFPDAVPLRALDYARLAQLNLAGGHIRNIALGAAFLAAERRGPVTMELIGEATRTEYDKLERSMSEAETRGWA